LAPPDETPGNVDFLVKTLESSSTSIALFFIGVGRRNDGDATLLQVPEVSSPRGPTC
jgi:hypothetical protein